MYLKRLDIKNFRAFDEEGVSLIFNQGVNAIIGENNSGKSSVIDAIRIAYSTVTYKKDIFFSKSDFHVNEDGTMADYAQFDVFLEDVPKRLVEIWNPQSESGKGGDFHIKFEKYIAPSGMEKVRSVYWGFGTEGNSLTTDTFEATDVVFLGALRDSENEMKPSKNSKLAQLLRNMVPEEEIRKELVQILTDANNSLLEKDQLIKTKTTINNNLAKIEQEFLNQQIDIGLVEPRFDSIASSLRAWIKPKWILINKSDSVYEKAMNYYKSHEEIKKMQADTKGIYFEISILEDQMDIDPEVSSRIKELANSSFELYQNGLGYNNLLFMSAVLGDMAIEKGGIYHNLLLIEEPEAHLHPQLQELVHSFLENANRNDSNIQIIYTSHSPTLASKIDIENINLIYEYGHKKYCLPFSEAKLNEDNKKYLQRYLDVTKSQMFFARGILFVEGISEAILVPEMAKALDRPLEKYAVELVNVDSVAFKPFVNLFSSKQVKTCFKKVSIITDDDRCSKKNEKDYISKDFDYDNVSSEIVVNLENGQPSDRYKELETLCSGTEINIFSAYKTLEYALCCSENNIYHMVEAIKNCYVDLGPKLEEKIATLSELSEKAACVWLFIRTRDKCKGAVAQYISQVISDQKEKKNNKETIEKEFIIPEYLKDAIYSVTEKKVMKEQLTEEQKKFLTVEGKVVVKACPGSGKTYSVAHKLLSYIDNWKDYHSGVAVLSFTNVASNEIQEKAQTIHGSLGELGYPHFIGTVDSFIDEFIVLRYGHLDTVSNVRPRITITDTWKMPYGFWRKECHSRGCTDNIEQFYYGIDKQFYKGNEPVKCEKRNARSLPCQQYKKMLQDKGIIFQNETALFAYQLLKKYPMVASAIAERFPVIIIDEAQDTSVNQMAVFDLLSKSGVKSMFLVGDADQSIYEWRNASPECFLQKVEDTSWQTIELTGNFRSSQSICNVTSYFAASLRGTKSNNAIGYWKDEVQKPILLLTKNNSENDTIDYFIKKCMEMQIGISPKNVAVLTRGRIYSDTDIKGLWKSVEIELYAKAAYEWKYGSRKKAYENTEKATYCMIFNEDTDKYMMQQKIREHTTEESWKDFIINILINMPDVDMEIAEWVKEFSTIFVDVCKNCEYKISPDKEIKDTFKIKRNDNKSPDFKKISLKKFFEKKNEEKYTRSSIHGVKGESYEAVLLHVKSRTGSTITPKLLMEGKLEQELMRLAYVAMTRPRRLLMLAMPDTKGIKTCGRFPEELWTYENL